MKRAELFFGTTSCVIYLQLDNQYLKNKSTISKNQDNVTVSAEQKQFQNINFLYCKFTPFTCLFPPLNLVHFDSIYAIVIHGVFRTISRQNSSHIKWEIW